MYCVDFNDQVNTSNCILQQR